MIQIGEGRERDERQKNGKKDTLQGHLIVNH
jgi:hypothetical protein